VMEPRWACTNMKEERERELWRDIWMTHWQRWVVMFTWNTIPFYRFVLAARSSFYDFLLM
jgi:hypothetical protein